MESNTLVITVNSVCICVVGLVFIRFYADISSNCVWMCLYTLKNVPVVTKYERKKLSFRDKTHLFPVN